MIHDYDGISIFRYEFNYVFGLTARSNTGLAENSYIK